GRGHRWAVAGGVAAVRAGLPLAAAPLLCAGAAVPGRLRRGRDPDVVGGGVPPPGHRGERGLLLVDGGDLPGAVAAGDAPAVRGGGGRGGGVADRGGAPAAPPGGAADRRFGAGAGGAGALGGAADRGPAAADAAVPPVEHVSHGGIR